MIRLPPTNVVTALPVSVTPPKTLLRDLDLNWFTSTVHSAPGIKDGDVGGGADGERAAGYAQDARGDERHLFHYLRQCQKAGFDEVRHDQG